MSAIQSLAASQHGLEIVKPESFTRTTWPLYTLEPYKCQVNVIIAQQD